MPGWRRDRVAMSKAFVKEDAEADEEEDFEAPTLPAGTKNYMTAGGYRRMKARAMLNMNAMGTPASRPRIP